MPLSGPMVACFVCCRQQFCYCIVGIYCRFIRQWGAEWLSYLGTPLAAPGFDKRKARPYPSCVADNKKGNQLAILDVLRASEAPLSSARISEELAVLGHEMSERTVRLYLQGTARHGFTRSDGRRGHVITEAGLAELRSTSALERVGFMSARIDRMTYRMDFDLTTKRGTIVVNVTLVRPAELAKRLDLIARVYECGYAMGRLVTLFGPGQGVDHVVVPPGMVGMGTVCSVTLNGVLLKYGIPTNSRFGGLLELVAGKPTRFVEVITYDGTSIDPLEVFISSGMTNYVGAVQDGNGRIGASFREFPVESRGLVEGLAGRLERGF